MGTKVYEFPDGKKFELDFDNPEHKAWAEKYAAEKATPGDTATDWGKVALRGLGLGAKFVMERGLLGSGQTRDGSYIESLPKEKQAAERARFEAERKAAPSTRFGEWLDKTLPPKEGFLPRVVEGAAQGLPTTARMMIPSVLANAAGTAASEGVGRFLPEGTPEGVKAPAQIIAALLAGGGTSLATGPKNPETAINKAKRDSGILTQVGLGRVSPEVDPSAVSNRTTDVANTILSTLRRVGGDSYGQRVAGQNIRGVDAAGMYTGLNAVGNATPRQGLGDAYREVADALIAQGGNRFITGVQDLSLQLKGLKDNPLSAGASSGRKIADADLREAVGTAETMLGGVSPAYQNANDRFRSWYDDVVNPVQEGPLGKLADKNPNLVSPTPASRLEAIVADRGPQEITDTLSTLQAGGANPASIARALLQRRVNEGPMTPEARIFGGPGSGQEAQMQALIQGAGADVGRVRQPFAAADATTEAHLAGAGNKEFATVGMVPPSLNARIMHKLGLAEGSPKQVAQQRVNEVLRSATPEELQELQRLSMFDPRLRTMLTIAATAKPLMTGE